MGGAFGDAYFVALRVELPFNLDKGFAPFGKGVYHRNADPVKAAGDLIGLFVEFSACMEPGHDQFQGADLFFGVHSHRNTPAVIFYTDNIVSFQNHKDFRTVALHGFVYRIIYNFIYQMVKTVYTGGSYVHAGTFPHRIKALENLDILSRIAGIHFSIILSLQKKVKMAYNRGLLICGEAEKPEILPCV
jgi:hypothetical protein